MCPYTSVNILYMSPLNIKTLPNNDILLLKAFLFAPLPTLSGNSQAQWRGLIPASIALSYLPHNGRIKLHAKVVIDNIDVISKSVP